MSNQEEDDDLDLEIVEDEEGDIATGYMIQISEPDNEMRVLMLDEDGVICSHVMTAAEAYTFAQSVLRGYDKLEGI